MISPQPEHENSLRQIFGQSSWRLHKVSTCCDALTYLRDHDTAVVICERDLPDGDWKLVLDRLDSLPSPPSLVVTSKVADALLWAEVLNLGGYSVLAQPFEAQEVYRVVFLAWDEQMRGQEDRQIVIRALNNLPGHLR